MCRTAFYFPQEVSLPEIWIHHFNQIADKYLLEKSISELPSEMVCAPEIVSMHHYDEKHHTQYMATLKAYLDHNMQPVSTARWRPGSR